MQIGLLSYLHNNVYSISCHQYMTKLDYVQNIIKGHQTRSFHIKSPNGLNPILSEFNEIWHICLLVLTPKP